MKPDVSIYLFTVLMTITNLNRFEFLGGFLTLNFIKKFLIVISKNTFYQSILFTILE